MLLRSIGRALLAATALLPCTASAEDKDNPSGQSTFISPNGDLGFAFTVANNSGLDVYFSIRARTKRAWAGVGLGSDDMKGALFLIIYRGEDGNVTFSPRTASGNDEPTYYPALEYDVLEGTGVKDGYMTFNARCTKHCRSWPAGNTDKGYIDVSSPNQKAIYALGPKQKFKDNSQKAGLKIHAEYGTFTIDMKRTIGSGDLPVLTDESDSDGTTLDRKTTDFYDKNAILHGTLMLFAFVWVFPIGAVFLKLGNLAKWHGANQAVGVLSCMAGFGMGIWTSFRYHRSNKFDSFHQILGFAVVGFVLIQFGLGILHHLNWKKTKQPTKYSKIHLWTGRFLIPIGAANGYIGFKFAQDQKYSLVVIGVVVLMIFLVVGVAVWQTKNPEQQRQQLRTGYEGGNNQGRPSEPWRTESYQGSGSSYPNDPPPGYEAPSAQIGLQNVTPWRSGGADRMDDHDHDHNLGGSVQKPREFA